MRPIDIRGYKQELRLRSKERRKAMPQDEKQALDRAVAENVRRLKEYRPAKTILIYMSTPIEVDTVEIINLDGSIETILRHHTTIFKKLYSLIIGFSLVDSYEMTAEEEAALIADRSKFIAKFSLTDEEGGIQTVELYKLTERKTYVVVNGSGGFYLSSSYVNKVVEGIDLFIEGKDIKLDK